MEIRRRADNFLLSDRVFDWVPWSKLGRIPTRSTITGVPRIFARQQAQILVCRADCTFASDDTRSSLANYREILRLQEANQTLLFTDRSGTTTEVALLDFSDPETWEEVKHKTVFNAEFTFVDLTPRWY